MIPVAPFDDIVRFNFPLRLDQESYAPRAVALFEEMANVKDMVVRPLCDEETRILQIVSHPLGCDIKQLAAYFAELALRGLVNDLVGFTFDSPIPGEHKSGIAVFEPAISAVSITLVDTIIKRLKDHTLILDWKTLVPEL